MSENLHELFQAAAKFFFHKYKTNGGSLGGLARQLGTSHTYISAVINGSRTASLELQNRIAKALYGPYDKFIAAGRRIRCGLKPEFDRSVDSLDDIESLITHLSHYVVRQKEIEKKLASSEERFRDICFTIGGIIFELDENMVYIYLAGGVHEMLGHPEEEILNNSIYDFLTAEESKKLRTLIEASIANNKIINSDINVRQNNELKHLHLTAKPVITQNGEFMGFRGIYRDITANKRKG